jgi:hypothetical protein
LIFSILFFYCTGTRIRTLIKGFGDLYSTIELFPSMSKAVSVFQLTAYAM